MEEIGELLGEDFSTVRFIPSSRHVVELGALAFARGEHVAFAPGQFRPETSTGRRLIAHELAHVAQQRRGRLPATGSIGGQMVNENSHLEKEAEQIAAKAEAVTGEGFPLFPTLPFLPYGLGSFPAQMFDPRKKKAKKMRTKRTKKTKKPILVKNQGLDELDEEVNSPKILKKAISKAFGHYKQAHKSILVEPDDLDYTMNENRWAGTPSGQQREKMDEIITENGEERFQEQPRILPWQEAEPGHQYTPEEKDLKHEFVDEVIEQTVEENKDQDTAQLAQDLVDIRDDLKLTSIELVGIGTKDAAVEYTFNPTYKVLLNKAGTHIAARMEGNKKNSKFQTKVDFKPSQLNFKLPNRTNPIEYPVGSVMVADPLSQDHQVGSESSQDNKHDELMNLLLKASGSENKYIKGHLLNDHLGGPATPSNLFPITDLANKNHLKWLEKYVKAEVAAGFVVSYRVDVVPIPASIIPKSTSGKYTVDAAFQCQFARLDQSGKQIQDSEKKITIESKYGDTSQEHDIQQERAFQNNRFDKLHYGTSTPVANAVWNNEAIFQDPGYNQSVMNAGKKRDISFATVSSLTGFSNYGNLPTIDRSAVPTKKLSLMTTRESTLVKAWKEVTSKAWPERGIKDWISKLKHRKGRLLWKNVHDEAVAQGLSQGVADELFQAYGVGRNVMRLS